MIKSKVFTRVGVVGFGGYVPEKRIKLEEIAKVNDKDGKQVMTSLGVKQKAVASKDEDVVSLGVEAAKRGILRSGIDVKEIGAVLVGSESHPYSVKPTGTIVADILGVGNNYVCADLEFACKAGTTGIVMVAAMIEAGLIDLGLAIGADTAQSKPGDALEYTAAAGAGAILLGSKKYKWVAGLERMSSFNSDTPDFWRREGERYPSHAGRFTGEPGYFKHVVGGTEQFLEKYKLKIKDFKYVVLHMPNGKFPKRAAKRLGVNPRQLETGLIVKQVGNPYSASSMLGLVKVLETAKKSEKILVTSYGSGAGSDSLSFKVIRKMSKKSLDKARDKKIDLEAQFKQVEYISYADYLKLERYR